MSGKPERVLKRIVRVLILLVILILLLVVTVRVLINQPVIAGRSQRSSPGADPRILRKHVQYLSKIIIPRNHSHPENLDRAAAYIFRAVKATGAQVRYQVFTAGKKEYRNVIGALGPETNEILIVGAHYDAFGEMPGADDNASAVAGLLELARLLVDKPLKVRTELVAYSLEEPPYFGSQEMGSAVHAEQLGERGVTVRAMLCLEMIGYFTDGKQWDSWMPHLAYPGKGNFILVAGRWTDRALALKVKRAMKGAAPLSVHSYSGPTLGLTDLSDHRNYWARGHPAVMITDTAFIRNHNYHTSRDTAETLNYDAMAGVVDGVRAAVMALQEE